MVAGVPGSFKTCVVTNAIVSMKVPTLCFSTDSSIETVRTRLLAIASGKTTEQTEDLHYTNPQEAQRLLAQFDFLRWDFSPTLDMDDIWLSAYAYHEVEGVYPEQIVVDICSDVAIESGDEWAALRELMRRSKELARETGAHVLLVHHASDSPNTKRPCPRRSDIHGKVAAIPELIITCGTDPVGNLHVACVKNRWSKADKDADNHFQMALDAERMKVGDYVAPVASTIPYPAWAGWDQHDYAED